MDTKSEEARKTRTPGQNIDFVCPKCRVPIELEGPQLQCSACSTEYEFDNGLFKFSTEQSEHGELSREEMHQLLDAAERIGWREALANLDGEDRTRITNLITSPRRKMAVSLLEGAGQRVLDFGCGYGGVSLVLAELFDQVVSLDGSEERVSMLNTIRRQEGLNNITPVCHMDTLQLPFPDNYFDAIVLTGVFEYLPLTLSDLSIREAHTQCLQSFLRILRPGGRLLLNTKNRFGWPYLLGGKDHTGVRFAPAMPIFLPDFILRMKGKGAYRIVNYSFGGYQRLLRHAGFSDVKMYCPFPGYQVPHSVFDLSSPLILQIPREPMEESSWVKTSALRLLARIGLLRFILPHYSVFAIKN